MLITNLELATADLPTLRGFYTHSLSLPLLATDSQSCTLAVGATQLTFTHSPTAYRYHFAFNLPIAQFSSAKAWLKARTPLIADTNGQDEFESQGWKARNFYFYDPAGNILEFIARPAQSQFTESAFSPVSLLAVCEIGLATPDVLATVTRLHSELGLTVYDGEGSDTFTAVGQASGLFIVVRQNRLWYPDTGVPATLNPLKVRLATGAQVRQTATDLQISLPVLP